jgi:hypothetical protein
MFVHDDHHASTGMRVVKYDPDDDDEEESSSRCVHMLLVNLLYATPTMFPSLCACF